MFLFISNLFAFHDRCVGNFPMMNAKTKLDLKRFKRKNLVLIFRNFLTLCTNLKPYMYARKISCTVRGKYPVTRKISCTVRGHFNTPWFIVYTKINLDCEWKYLQHRHLGLFRSPSLLWSLVDHKDFTFVYVETF